MAKSKIKVPTDEALAKAERALAALAEKKPETATDKIWNRLGNVIEAARKSGHSWDDIAAALAASGISVSASTLRSAAPKTSKPRRPRAAPSDAKEASSGGPQGSHDDEPEGNSAESAHSDSQEAGATPAKFTNNPVPDKEKLV
ncbi:hypothetical protein H9X51_004996 [Escherichia coli]|uniref:hypothetical protein n=1 Tax=Klebsiella pneumoniae TaxID=573 RepID=UPI0019B4C2A4|nr:hypothetical protein [Escherichia coli]EGN4329227.1 hypothetical protein [Escherichia coli]